MFALRSCCFVCFGCLLVTGSDEGLVFCCMFVGRLFCFVFVGWFAGLPVWFCRFDWWVYGWCWLAV